MKIQWLKLDTDILSDQKIKIIRKNPLGDQIFVLWIGLLCQAMQSENKGFIEIADGISATPEEIASICDLPIEVVKIGLKTFSRLKMIEISENGIEINNFREKQSIESLEYQRERNRIKQANHRDKLKNETIKLIEDNHVSNRLVPSAKRENKILELELEKEYKNKDLSPNGSSVIDDEHIFIFNLWNEQEIHVHKDIEKFIKPIASFLKTKDFNSACQCIKNYGEVINHSEKYWFTYKGWTLDLFLKRGYKGFLDEAKPLENYAKKGLEKKSSSPVDQVNKFLEKYEGQFE